MIRECVLIPLIVSFVFLVVQGQNEQQIETARKIRANQEPTFGTWVYLKDPAITEMLAHAGYDWVIIDMEHSNLDEDLVQSLVVPLIASKTVPIVRLPEVNQGLINKLLDTGVQGILVPFITSKQDAEDAVRYSKYPPQGNRGIGYGRSQGWGGRVQEYLEIANEAIVVGVIIETREALENVDEIVTVPGLDFVLAGTFDLSGALGVLGQFDHPRVAEAKKRIEEACKRNHVATVSWSLDQEGVSRAIKNGSNLITLAGDVDWLRIGMVDLLKAAQEVAGH